MVIKFGCFSMAQFDAISRTVRDCGKEVCNTRELVNVCVSSDNLTKDKYEHLFADDSIKTFDEWLDDNFKNGDKNENFGPYIFKYYSFLKDSIESVIEMLSKSLSTRQALVAFDSIHCFNSIQFLFRDFDKKIGGNTKVLKVFCSMRSCNAEKNLKYDFHLCYYLATWILNELFKKGLIDLENVKIQICMYVGSLHVFEV